MRLKKFLIVIMAAVLVAAAASFGWESMPVEERLIRLQAQEQLPGYARIEDEPVEIQALLLDYSSNEVLLLKAQAALLTYPDLARSILPLYGQEPEFQEILLKHGESIFPPIAYFLTHEVRSVAVMYYTSRKFEEAKTAVERYWNPGQTVGERSVAQAEALTPEQRAWYAINFIHEEGHGFLGQFVVDPEGNARWIQSERWLEGATDFFASGVRNLETKVQTGEDVSAGDAGWAAVDALVVVGAVKFLRMGRAAATSTRSVGAAGRSAAVSSRLARASRIGLQVGRYSRWPAAIALGYVVITHPGVINDVLAGIAEVVGLPAWLVQMGGWLLLLIPVFYIGSWIMRLLVRPSIWFLRAIIAGLARLDRRSSKRPGEPA